MNIEKERRMVCAKIIHYGSTDLCNVSDPCLYCKPLLEQAGFKNKKLGFFARLWKKTIFPDIIKRRKEEKNLMTEMRHEAKLEALRDSKEELKKHYKEKEMERLKGGGSNKFTNILKKVGDDLAGSGFKLPSSDKIGNAMGSSKNNNNSNQGAMGMGGNSNGMFDQNKIAGMMGGSRTPQPKTPNHYTNNRFDSNRLSGLIRDKEEVKPQVKKKRKVTKKKRKAAKKKKRR